MIGVFLGERASAPAFHARRENRNYINSPGLGFHITADFLKTFAPKKLTRSGNVLDTAESEVVGRAVFGKGRSGNAESGGGREFPEQKLEVVVLKCDVSIEAGYNVVRKMLYSRISRIEAMGLASKVSRLA